MAKELSPEVAKKYKLGGGMHATKAILAEKYGREAVDFETMSLAKADQLVEKFKSKGGFPYLVPLTDAEKKTESVAAAKAGEKKK